MQESDLNTPNPFSNEAQIWIDYIQSKTGAGYSFSQNDETMIFKVCHKVFAVIGSEKDETIRINLKCDPDRALELRNTFECIVPGHHMNKKHWNTVLLNGELSESDVEQLIDDSYDLVISGLNDKQLEQLNTAK